MGGARLGLVHTSRSRVRAHAHRGSQASRTSSARRAKDGYNVLLEQAWGFTAASQGQVRPHCRRPHRLMLLHRCPLHPAPLCTDR